MSAVARHLARALDPAVLARDCGLDVDPYQADVLRSDVDRILLLWSRQVGKSATAALLALHLALYWPGSLALLLSPSLRQSSELFRQVATFYGALGNDALDAEAESALRIELVNGSRVVSLPGTEKTVRGYSGVDLLVVDEAARVDDALYYSVRPMLAVSGGRLVALSTPWGKRGWFYGEWQDGQGWQKSMVTADHCPRISPEFLDGERATLPERWYRQEYGCEFLETSDALLTYEQVVGALSADVKPLFAEAVA